MLFNSVTESELEDISSEARPYVDVKDFVVFCFAKTEDISEDDLTVNGKYYFIRGENHLDLIIADVRYKLEAAKKINDYYYGRSRTYHHFFELKQAFCEAAYMRRIAFKSSKHAVSAKYFRLPENHSDYGIKVMMQAVNLICSNKLDEVLHQIQIFIDAVKKDKCYIEEFDEQMQVVLTIAMKQYKNAIIDGNEAKELLDTFRFQTIDDYFDAVRDWFINLSKRTDSVGEELKTKEKMERAIEYIKENYKSDLNMAVVSNYISMYYSLFSFTFKQYTGENFVNFLKDIRVGKAKRLLVETD